jgi:hypothetical protein
MKIDMTQELVDLTTGEKLQDGTLRGICVRALLFRDPNSQMSGDDQLKRYMLAQRLQENDEVDLQAHEITLIKDSIAIIFQPMVTGQAWLLLDPPGEDKK